MRGLRRPRACREAVLARLPQLGHADARLRTHSLHVRQWDAMPYMDAPTECAGITGTGPRRPRGASSCTGIPAPVRQCPCDPSLVDAEHHPVRGLPGSGPRPAVAYGVPLHAAPLRLAYPQRAAPAPGRSRIGVHAKSVRAPPDPGPTPSGACRPPSPAVRAAGPRRQDRHPTASCASGGVRRRAARHTNPACGRSPVWRCPMRPWRGSPPSFPGCARRRAAPRWPARPAPSGIFMPHRPPAVARAQPGVRGGACTARMPNTRLSNAVASHPASDRTGMVHPFREVCATPQRRHAPGSKPVGRAVPPAPRPAR